MLDGDRLVRIELLDAARFQRVAQPVVDACGKRRVGGRLAGQDAHGGDPAVGHVTRRGNPACEAIQDRLQRHFLCSTGPFRRLT